MPSALYKYLHLRPVLPAHHHRVMAEKATTQTNLPMGARKLALSSDLTRYFFSRC